MYIPITAVIAIFILCILVIISFSYFCYEQGYIEGYNDRHILKEPKFKSCD